MRVRDRSSQVLLLLVIWCACASHALAQDQKKTTQNEDVIRVDTMQTDVMVFDKGGSFVNDLKRDQFSLKIDGKPRDISLFERVTAGSRNEEAQLAAARGSGNTVDRSLPKGIIPLDRGRTIFFLVDDFHLSPGSMNQARMMLSRFIDRDMGQNDEAAIASSSGQIGFLQQLTDNKTVLRTAIERLRPRPYLVRTMDRPPMSEYQALRIDQNDNDVFDFFVDQVLRDNPGLSRQTAEEMVHSRASDILHAAASITTNTLATLEALIKNSRPLPGRKVLFLISDGFFLDNRNSDAYDRLRHITSIAAASGTVIYSIDARGLSAGMDDASTETAFDPSGRLARGNSGERSASQDALNALAVDTGGRAFFNTNALSAAVTTGLKESSTYYLLAWRPETEDQLNQKFRRIEVNVIGRPNLVVRFRRGFGEVAPSEPTSAKNTPAQTNRQEPAQLLVQTLRAPYPRNALPVALSLNFVDVQQYGATLTISIKVSTNSLTLEPAAGSSSANLDVAGAVFDDQGKSFASFNKRLTIKSNSAKGAAAPPESVFYNHFTIIKPGLYQVRVAAVDEKQSRAGSAVRWIEIPDLGSKTLAMSTLIVGEKKDEAETQTNIAQDDSNNRNSPLQQVSLNVDHRFARSSRLRFLTFVYNTAPVAAKTATKGADTVPATSRNEPSVTSSAVPDLAVQVQVFRDNEPVITTPMHKIETEGVMDPTRIPYAADVRLDNLQSGRYLLQVTIVDRVAKTSASQKYDFQVD